MIRLLLLLLVVGGCALYVARLLERRRRERLALARSSFLVSPAGAREAGPALKSVALRSGAACLRIPERWSEEYPDRDRASFRDPGNPQRLLRVTCETVAPGQAGLRAVLQGRAGREATTLEELSDGRVLLKRLDPAREGDQQAVVFRWLTASASPPSHVLVATFALSVPERAALDPLTRDLVAVLDQEVRAARSGAE